MTEFSSNKLHEGVTGDRQPATGGVKNQASSDRRPATGNWQPGDLATVERKPVAVGG
jgi:hypothetical protein